MNKRDFISSLPLRSIKGDQGIQQRARMLDSGIVAEYAEAMTAGSQFPPVIVYHDGSTHWLADGYHRLEAADEAGLTEIKAEVRKGDKRDAILYAVGANRDHGLRRSRADVRRAITTLVQDAEWGQMANRAIAEKVGCSDKTVASVRDELVRCGNSATEDTDQGAPPPTTQVGNFPNCDDEARGIPPSVNSLAEAVAGLNAVFNRDTAPPPPPKAPPPPAKRTGRDGKSYPTTKARPTTQAKPAPTPAPKPAPAVNKARLAMQAAHGVAAALTALEPLEADLLPEDAVTVLCNLRTALTRLELWFGRGYMEVLHNA